MANFPTWIPDSDFHNFALLDLFISSDTSICSTMAVLYDYCHAGWDELDNHLRDVPWENIFKFSVSATATEFCEWVQVEIKVYIHHRKYQVKPHSPPWLSAT